MTVGAMSVDWLKVYEDFDELSKTDKHRLFEVIKEVLMLD